MKKTSLIAVGAVLALMGAGCSQSTQMNVDTNENPQPSAVAPQGGDQMQGDMQATATMDDSAWTNDDINADIKAAQQEDMQQEKTDKQSSDGEVQASQKDDASASAAADSETTQ